MRHGVDKAIVIDFNIETRNDFFVWGGYGLALYLWYQDLLVRAVQSTLSELGLPVVLVKAALALVVYLVMSAQWRFVSKRVEYDEAHPAYWRRLWAKRTSAVMAVMGAPVYFSAGALLMLLPVVVLERLRGVVPFVRLAPSWAVLVGGLVCGAWSGWRSGRLGPLFAGLGFLVMAAAFGLACLSESLSYIRSAWPWVVGAAALCGLGGWAGERYFRMSMKRVPRAYVLPEKNV
jgi:hypothetical protein